MNRLTLMPIALKFVAVATTIVLSGTAHGDTTELKAVASDPQMSAEFAQSHGLPEHPQGSGRWKRLSGAVEFAPLPEDPTIVATKALERSDRAGFARAANGRPYSAMLVYEDGTNFARAGEVDLGYVVPPEGFGAWNPEGMLKVDETQVEKGMFNGSKAVGTESIIGGTLNSDRRIRYSAAATLTAYPFRTVGSISGNGNTKSGSCSGVIIGPRHVLTAAHCLHDSNGNWYSPLYFNPGQTNNVKLNGSHKMVARWARDHGIHKKYDYGVMVLKDSPALASLGWMGIAWWNNQASYDGRFAYNKGYPLANNDCKASPLANDNCDGWMYGDADSLESNAATNNHLLQYDIDTQTGHSGSPVYHYLGGSPAVLAVHGYGAGGSLLNYGARFRGSMYNDVCSWIGNIDSAYAAHPNCN